MYFEYAAGDRKKETIYVGDAPGDIVASRQAGIRVIFAAWAATAEPGQLKSLQPDQLVHTIKDIADWLFVRI